MPAALGRLLCFGHLTQEEWYRSHRAGLPRWPLCYLPGETGVIFPNPPAANFEVSFGFLNRGTLGVLHMLLGSSLVSSALPLHTTFLSAQLFLSQPLEFAWAALSTWMPFICLPRPKQTSCLLLLTSKRMSHRSLSVSVAQHGCLNDRPFCRAHEARAAESR